MLHRQLNFNSFREFFIDSTLLISPKKPVCRVSAINIFWAYLENKFYNKLLIIVSCEGVKKVKSLIRSLNWVYCLLNKLRNAFLGQKMQFNKFILITMMMSSQTAL